MTSLGLEFILAKLDPESILHYRANFQRNSSTKF